MMTNVTSKLQISAILLMFTGWGWVGGNFSSTGPALNPLLHCIGPLLLLIVSLPILRMQNEPQSSESNVRWAYIGVTLIALLGIVGSLVLVALGASNPDPNAVGVKSLYDWYPTVILNIGTFLWLGTLVFSRHPRSEIQVASNN